MNLRILAISTDRNGRIVATVGADDDDGAPLGYEDTVVLSSKKGREQFTKSAAAHFGIDVEDV